VSAANDNVHKLHCNFIFCGDSNYFVIVPVRPAHYLLLQLGFYAMAASIFLVCGQCDQVDSLLTGLQWMMDTLSLGTHDGANNVAWRQYWEFQLPTCSSTAPYHFLLRIMKMVISQASRHIFSTVHAWKFIWKLSYENPNPFLI